MNFLKFGAICSLLFAMQTNAVFAANLDDIFGGDDNGKIKPTIIKRRTIVQPQKVVQETTNSIQQVDVDIKYGDLNYVLVHCGEAFIKEIKITNNSDSVCQNLSLEISIRPETFSSVWIETISNIAPGETKIIKNIDLPLKHKALYEVNEKMKAFLVVQVKSNNNLLYAKTNPLSVLPYNIAVLDKRINKTLSAFVQPNSREIKQFIKQARSVLFEKTNTDSFPGYQAGEERVFEMIEALHQTMQEQNITYINPPASFYGQKIRSPKNVIDNSQGTCIDLAVLYASLWEGVGLNPVLVLIPGHAFMGCWDVDRTHFPETVTVLNKISKNQIHLLKNLKIFNSTDVTSGGSCIDAAKTGFKYLENCILEKKAIYIIDVKKARDEGITPLPY